MGRNLRTANFIVTNAHRPFVRGQWDCNLFITDLLDHLDGGNRSEDIRGKYHDKRTAIKFQSKYTPAPDFIAANGFTLVEKDSTEFKDHDIILAPCGKYWTASLYFGGATWSVIEDQGMMMNTVEPGTYLVGEYNGK